MTQTEAAKRLAQYGRNELQAAQKVSLWAVYLPVLELAKWLERRGLFGTM